MALDFPSNPTNGQVYGQWLWDGAKWGPTQPTTIVGPGEGDITAVYPGNGLSGGGFSGDVTLALQTPVSVANGGTGANTPAGALFSLGAAPILSPTFVGDPKAPTPPAGDNDTSLATTAWVKLQNYKSGGNVTISDVAPIAVGQGDLWWNSSPGIGELFINYFDGNSTQWVIANPRTGPSGPPGQFQSGPGLTINYGTTPPTIDVVTPYLPLTGGHLSGRLYIDSAFEGISFPSLAGGAHGFAFAWNGSNLLMYVDNVYCGAVATTAVVGNYLPLTGGQLTGRLSMRPAVNGGADIVLWNTNGAYYTQIYNDTNTHIASALGNIMLEPTAAGWVYIQNSTASHGLLIQSAATGSYVTLYDDGNSHIGSTSILWLSGTDIITHTGPLRNAQGRIVSQNANSNPGFCCHWPGNYAAGMFLSGTNLYFGNMDGNGNYIGPAFGYFESGGKLNLANHLSVPNTATVGALSIYGGTFYNAFSNGWLYFNGSLQCWDLKSSNNVDAAGSLFCGGCQLYNNGGWLTSPQSIQSSGNLNAIGGTVFLNGMYWQNNGGWMYTPYAIRTDNYIRLNGIDVSNNSGYLYAPGLWSANDTVSPGVYRRSLSGSVYKGARLEMWYGSDWDNVAFAMGGGNFLFSPDIGVSGYYVTPTPFSDGRLKADIRDTEIDALAAIIATPVRAFSWNAEGISLQPHITDPHVDIGFVAQEVEETMPSAVEASPFGDHTLHMVDHNVTPYLVRAIQQLAARVAELEAK
jgi:hypothetical protein